MWFSESQNKRNNSVSHLQAFYRKYFKKCPIASFSVLKHGNFVVKFRLYDPSDTSKTSQPEFWRDQGC
jgi:hypothetical protein